MTKRLLAEKWRIAAPGSDVALLDFSARNISVIRSASSIAQGPQVNGASEVAYEQPQGWLKVIVCRELELGGIGRNRIDRYN
jgi:hypothetical protein